MLRIGELDNERDAHTFGDWLYVQGIDNRVDPGPGGRWEIWVLPEDQVAAAGRMLAEFRLNPGDPRYSSEAAGAAARRREAEKRAAAAAPIPLRPPGGLFPSGLPGPLTMTLIAISVIVYALGLSAAAEPIRQLLSIATFELGEESVQFSPHLVEVWEGQVWRLVTPIFLHFGILHIVFNMLWLRDLGGAVEKINGPTWFALLILAIAVPSNVGQFLWSGPLFGGMSGVVYGLLGYIWMKSRFDPRSGFALRPATVVMMMVWFVLCLFGLVGPIANVVHGVGLLVGMAWGFVSAKSSRRG